MSKQFIDRKTLAFTIPLKDNGKVWTLYIPPPSKERIEACVPVLGYIFSLRKLGDPAVIAKDYEYYAREASTLYAKRIAMDPREEDRIAEDMFMKFKGFVEASILGGTAIDQDGKAVSISKSGIAKDAVEDAAGMYVFFYTLSRYASQLLNENDMKDIATYLSVTEYQKRFGISSSGEENTPEKAKV